MAGSGAEGIPSPDATPGGTRYIVELAIIEMMVGASSAGIRLRGQFTIIGETAIIDCKVFANQVTVE